MLFIGISESQNKDSPLLSIYFNGTISFIYESLILIQLNVRNTCTNLSASSLLNWDACNKPWQNKFRIFQPYLSVKTLCQYAITSFGTLSKSNNLSNVLYSFPPSLLTQHIYATICSQSSDCGLEKRYQQMTSNHILTIKITFHRFLKDFFLLLSYQQRILKLSYYFFVTIHFQFFTFRLYCHSWH